MGLGSAHPLTQMNTRSMSWGIKADGAYSWQSDTDFMLDFPCILDKQIKARPTRMQQMMIYWQSIILQHVSGVFTLIIKTADRLSLPMVSCADRQHPLHSAHISLPDSPETQQPQGGQEIIGSDTQSALLIVGVKTPETCWGIIDCQ